MISFMIIYSVGSVTISQRNPKRIMALSQCCAYLLIILACTGIPIYNIEKAFKTLGVENKYLKSIILGTSVIFFLQMLNFINLIARTQIKTNRKLDHALVFANTLITALSFVILFINCLYTCNQDFTFWLIKFGIFSSLQIFILDPILVFIFLQRVKRSSLKQENKMKQEKDMSTFIKI